MCIIFFGILYLRRLFQSRIIQNMMHSRNHLEAVRLDLARAKTGFD